MRATSEITTFDFRLVRGGQAAFGKRHGAIGGSSLTLDNTEIPYQQLVDTTVRGERLILALGEDVAAGPRVQKFLGEGRLVVIHPLKLDARQLEKAIDRRASAREAELRRESLIATSRAATRPVPRRRCGAPSPRATATCRCCACCSPRSRPRSLHRRASSGRYALGILVDPLKLLHRDVFGRSGDCPNCHSPKVRWRGTLRSFSLAGALTVLLFVAVLAVFRPPTGQGGTFQDLLYHLGLFLMMAMLVSLAGAVVAGLSALFGRNRCEACGHRWR